MVLKKNHFELQIILLNLKHGLFWRVINLIGFNIFLHGIGAKVYYSMDLTLGGNLYSSSPLSTLFARLAFFGGGLLESHINQLALDPFSSEYHHGTPLLLKGLFWRVI